MPWQAQGHKKTNSWAALDIKKVISRPPRTHHFTPFQHELLSPLRYYFTTCSPASVTDIHVINGVSFRFSPFIDSKPASIFSIFWISSSIQYIRSSQCLRLQGCLANATTHVAWISFCTYPPSTSWGQQ